jgi:hypothetical protein
VWLHLFEGVSSACRLCKVRNRQKEGLVMADLQGGRADFYCKYCYEHLREKAKADIKLPPFIELGLKPVGVSLPPYLVKKGRSLVYFHPVDPIDLGLLIQRRKAQGG